MKKLALLLCAAFIFGLSGLKAQTNDGKILVGITTYLLGLPVTSGGSLFTLGFGSTKYKSDSGDEDGGNITSFSLQPKVGYFFSDNLAAGLETMIISSISKDPDDNKYTQSVFLIGPFGRYYVPTTKCHPFIEGELGLGYYREKESGVYEYDDKYNVFAYGLGAGITAPLGERAAFDFSLAYNHSSAKYSEDNPDNERIVTGSFGFKFGFIILLGGKE